MRWDLINYLADINQYQNYLEIGVQDYYSNCDKIRVPNKVAIDPDPRNKCDFKGTSDEYFAQLSKDVKFDLIFIDGLHEQEQVLRDINNSLKHLTPSGTIVVHDCLPETAQQAQPDDWGGPWMGTVYQAMVKVVNERSDLDTCVVNYDCGCGIIRKNGKPLNEDVANLGEVNFETYMEFRQHWLNIISIEEFHEKFADKFIRVETVIGKTEYELKVDDDIEILIQPEEKPTPTKKGRKKKSDTNGEA